MINKLHQEFESELKDINNQLQKLLQSQNHFLKEVGDYFQKQEGKLIRPLLTLLVGKLGENSRQQLLIQAAISLEILHMATLVHDDILDKSKLRRGQETIHRKWNLETAILFGDFLYAKSLYCFTALPDEITEILADTITEMIEGEMQQQENKLNPELSKEEYLLSTKKKTGSLLAASCKLGSIIANLSNQQISTLTDYGYYLGICFQIQDDILDYQKKSSITGKTTQNDLQRGIITLPFIYYYQSLSSVRQQEVKDILTNQPSGQQLKEIISQVNESNAIKKTTKFAQRFSKKSIKTISSLPPSKIKNQLIELAEYTLNRNK